VDKFIDNLGLITGFEDKTGQTDATGAGLAAGATTRLVQFYAQASRVCIITGLGVQQDPAGDGYITFQLVVNGVPLYPYDRIQSQIATLAQPSDVHLPIPPGSKVEIWATNTHATSAFQCAARVRAEYRDFQRPSRV